MKYAVVYEERLRKTYIVEAESAKDAEMKVLDHPSVDLTYEDFADRDAYISPYTNADGSATTQQLQWCEELR